MNSPTDESSFLELIKDTLGQVSESGAEVEADTFDLSQIDGINTGVQIFTYQGSLTTPGCNEAVTWLMVFWGFKVTDEQVIITKYLT